MLFCATLRKFGSLLPQGANVFDLKLKIESSAVLRYATQVRKFASASLKVEFKVVQYLRTAATAAFASAVVRSAVRRIGSIPSATSLLGVTASSSVAARDCPAPTTRVAASAALQTLQNKT